MKFHLNLQAKLIHRQLVTLGVYPLLFYFLSTLGFVWLSIMIFNRIEFAQYLYPCIPLLLIGSISDKKRNEFLKSIYTKDLFYKIRMVENSLISLPFILFLIYKEAYWQGASVLVFAILLSLFQLNSRNSCVIPTPFRRHPFEFTIGFRNTYLLILLTYVISTIGICVGNFNLALSGLVFLALTCSSFYSKPEPQYFVWVFAMTAKQFIRRKIQIALLYTLLLCLPIVLALSVVYVEHIFVIASILGCGLLFITAALLGKYAQYPSEINLIQGMSLAVSIIFLPLLLILIPLFYFKSIKRLNEILV